MSTSTISCRSCHQAIATRHHSGQIKVADGVRVVLRVDGSTLLICRCGESRIVKVVQKAA